MKILIAVLFLVSMSSGCSAILGESSIDKTNRMLVEQNDGQLEAFASALEICDEKPGCLVGVSLAFASNMGKQPLFRPESYLDYIREIRMWIDPVGNLVDRLQGGTGGNSGDRASNVIKGDGNVILTGNRVSADNGSSTDFSLSSAYSRTWTGYNREYTNQEPIMTLEGTE